MADFSRLPGPNADLWDWQLLAACRGVDSSLFFHPEGERGAARSARENSAKEVCMRCRVRTECAAHALAVREPYGVWGGLTEDEREELMGRARHRTPAAPRAASGGPGTGQGAVVADGRPAPGGLAEAVPGTVSGSTGGAAPGHGSRGAAPGPAEGGTGGGADDGSGLAAETARQGDAAPDAVTHN